MIDCDTCYTGTGSTGRNYKALLARTASDESALTEQNHSN